MKEYIITTEKGANQQLHELIRCKDCKYFIEQYVNPNGRTYNAHLCDAWVKNTDRDGFCHRAERKEE